MGATAICRLRAPGTSSFSSAHAHARTTGPAVTDPSKGGWSTCLQAELLQQLPQRLHHPILVIRKPAAHQGTRFWLLHAQGRMRRDAKGTEWLQVLGPLPLQTHTSCALNTLMTTLVQPDASTEAHGLVVGPRGWVRFSELTAQCNSAVEPSHLTATHEKHMAWSSPAPGLSRFRELMATKA